jgi:hypothetical protein
MPIEAPGRSVLAQQIQLALNQARNTGQQSSANSDQIIDQLAGDLTTAIHQYVTSIVVTVNTSGLIAGVLNPTTGIVSGTATTSGTS